MAEDNKNRRKFLVMITCVIVHDTRRKKINKTYPVKLRITNNRTPKYFATGIDLTKEEFAQLASKRISEHLNVIKQNLKEQEAAAVALIKSIKPFSFQAFERKFLTQSVCKNLLQATYENYITTLRKQGRLGNAVSYQCSLKSLVAFDAKVCFEAITVDFLNEYEGWMLAKGKSITTVGIYMRALRAVYNMAIEEGALSRDYYPFSKKKYQIPTGKNIKKAISLNDIGRIYYYEPEPANMEAESRAKDFWMFSYFANGINIKDMALLKNKNIQGDYIVFERAKTIRATRSNPKPISIFITEDIKQILERRGTKDPCPDVQIFPIIDPKTDLIKQRKDIQQFTKVMNKWTKRIGKKLGLRIDLTSYAARHSFSTVLKRSGASIEFISESLGHSAIKTTESYLDSFEKETKKEFAQKLTAFKV